MFNNNEFLETYFAAAKIGAVLVPVNTRLAAPELDFILYDGGVSEFVFGHAFEKKVIELDYPKRVRHRVSSGPSSLPDTLDYDDLIRQAA